MDNSLKFFLIGFAIGLTTTIVLDRSEGTTTFMESFVIGAFSLWQLLFMVTIITTVPFLAIEPLKKRFTRKNFLPFPFLAGNGTAFLLLGISGKIISILTWILNYVDLDSEAEVIGYGISLILLNVGIILQFQLELVWF